MFNANVLSLVISHAGDNQCVGNVISVVCNFVCLSAVCPRSNGKTTWTINAKLGPHIHL